MSHQPDNVSAGTQIVSKVEIRGVNHSLAHPRGAVGASCHGPTHPGCVYGPSAVEVINGRLPS